MMTEENGPWKARMTGGNDDHKRDWKEDVTREDLAATPQFEPFLDVLTPPQVAQLAQYMGGLQFYLPKHDSLRQVIIKRRVLADRVNGLEYQAIALRHNVSEAHVREICDSERREAARKRAREAQGRLF
jgi:Mor family transcriptional regulator